MNTTVTNIPQIALWLYSARNLFLTSKMSIDINGWSLEWTEGDHRCGWLVYTEFYEEFFSADEYQAAVKHFLQYASDQEVAEPASFKYYFLQRTTSILLFPDGEIEKEQFPASVIHDPTGSYIYGWVTYPKRLSFYQTLHFNLMPDDLLERTVLDLYRFFGRGCDWYQTVVAATRLFEIKTYRSILQNEGRSKVAKAVTQLIERGFTMADVEAFEEFAR